MNWFAGSLEETRYLWQPRLSGRIPKTVWVTHCKNVDQVYSTTFVCFLHTEFYKGKRVILTGASKGIGKSIAIQLAQLGVK